VKTGESVSSDCRRSPRSRSLSTKVCKCASVQVCTLRLVYMSVWLLIAFIIEVFNSIAVRCPWVLPAWNYVRYGRGGGLRVVRAIISFETSTTRVDSLFDNYVCGHRFGRSDVAMLSVSEMTGMLRPYMRPSDTSIRCVTVWLSLADDLTKVMIGPSALANSLQTGEDIEVSISGIVKHAAAATETKDVKSVLAAALSGM
jgi:hypothetical protein